jgi:hypothetical protein
MLHPLDPDDLRFVPIKQLVDVGQEPGDLIPEARGRQGRDGPDEPVVADFGLLVDDRKGK